MLQTMQFFPQHSYYLFSPFSNDKYRENTIGSFKSAAKYGAHMVEFDVQLTKDLVPIVYHDFNLLLEVQHQKQDSKRKLIIPFYKLTYEELKDFKVSKKTTRWWCSAC